MFRLIFVAMKTSISILFKSTRQKLGLSQEKMAEALDCSRVSISNYERGETIPGGEKVEKLMQLSSTKTLLE
jgi:transcriptional regulator with XRE-family HTH domain